MTPAPTEAEEAGARAYCDSKGYPYDPKTIIMVVVAIRQWRQNPSSKMSEAMRAALAAHDAAVTEDRG